MKVSFDFDGTLQLDKIQKIAKALIDNGHDVWIITTRSNESCHNNEDMFFVCGQVGIPLTKIIFVPNSFKVHKFIENKFDLHFDDGWDEIEEINKKGGLAILVTDDMSEVFTEMQFRFNNGT